jgi:PadR family transcriptional regulator PadR
MSTDLGIFELLVLMAVRAGGEQAYGVTIRQAVSSGRGREVSSGAVYTTLLRLERRGLVRSQVGDASESRGGRARRYYALTAAGGSAVDTNYAALRTLSRRMAPRTSRG